MPQDSPNLKSSFLNGKCPRCRTGNVFTYPLANITKFASTNDYCPHCNIKFEPEPGFYWGAMYISYAFSTGLLIISAILMYTYDWSLRMVLTFAPIVTLICLPFMFRYSRLIMLYFISPTTHRFDSKFISQIKSE